MKKRIVYAFPSVLLALLAPLTSVAKDQQPAPAPKSIEQLLGNTSYDTILAPQNFKSEQTGINLVKGQPIANGLPLAMGGKLKDFSPATTPSTTGKKLDPNTPLGKITAFTVLSVNAIVAANPEIAKVKASAVNWPGQGDKTLGEIATSEVGKLPLPDSVTNSTPIAKFGNIANTPYSKYPGAEKLPLDKFPGLPQVPIAKTITIPTTPTSPNVRLVRVNKVFTKENDFNSKVVSGSDQRPKAKWDKNTPASGVELVSILPDQKDLTNGSVAIIGATQMLPGGNLPSPPEPTGLDIPGTPFKISFEQPDAKKGSVAIQLNMRLEYSFGLKTSHFIPIPTGITVTEASKTALLPLEIPLPDRIAKSAGSDFIKTPQVAASNNSAQSEQPQQSLLTPSPEQLLPQSDVKEKDSALGTNVKSSTNPMTGTII
jgi:hypothetical protein